jgi:hypothetical protein
VKRLRLCQMILAAALVAAVLGCSRSQSNDDFVPREEVGRAALDAYLRAWARGEMAQRIPDTNPPVMATDELRIKGRVLKSYSILGQVPADAPVCFAVDLKLDNPPADLRERYVVVGIDPLWVWRYDDFLMIMHWDHPMPEDGKSPTRPKKR